MNRVLRSAAIVGLIWLLAGIPTGSSAQTDEGPFAGFSTNAWGSALSFVYDDPDGVIPAHPTMEMHAAYALAQLDAGPSGHGVATTFWPGPTAATAAPFIEDSFWAGFEEGSRNGLKVGDTQVLPGSEPPPRPPPVAPKGWPAAAEVFEPAGPHTSDVPPNAHAHSASEVVFAKSAVVPLTLPGVFTADGGSSTSQSGFEQLELADGRRVDAVRSRVTSTIEDVAVLGGMVKIDEVTTTADVYSDGEKPVIAGRTVVSGLTIAGQGFTIDEKGIHAGGETHENPLLAGMNDAGAALADQGVTMTVASPIDLAKGAEGSRTAGGLVIRIDSRRLDEAVSELPDELERQVRANVSTAHSATIVLGAANVKASAIRSLEFLFEDIEFDLSDFGDGSFDAEVLGTTFDAGSFDAGSFGQGDALVGPSPGAGTVVEARPAFAPPVDVEGVGAAAVIIGLGAVLGGARMLKVLSDRLLARGGATPCPLGDD